MSNKKNVLWLLLFNVVSIFTQFLVYRIIFKHLGAEQMGIWSLLSAATTLGLISNFGFGSGLIKYTAEAVANQDKANIQLLAGTANISNIFLSLPFVVLFYYVSIFFAKPILANHQLIQFKYILPYCMLALYINNIASTFLALLDGYNNFTKRCIIQILGFVLYGSISITFIAKYNLAAVSYALCFQALGVFIASVYLVFKSGITVSILPLQFDKIVFKRLLNYGMKFQLINVLVFLFDPIIKFFITKNFGLPSTATYELASKLVIQVRTIVVNLLQVMVPHVASLKNIPELQLYVAKRINLNTFLSLNTVIAMLFAIPIASFFFTGFFSSSFIVCSLILLVGWFSNMVIAPLYFTCLGLEKLTLLISQHFLISIITISLFVIIGTTLNNNLSFLIPSIALAVGSFFLAIRFSANFSVGVTNTIKKYYLFFILFFAGAVILSIASKISIIFILLALGSILIAWCLLLFKSTEVREFYSYILRSKFSLASLKTKK